MSRPTLIQSYVRDRYFVSTMYRRSSAMLAPNHYYYETLAWEWDYDTKERGEMIRDLPEDCPFTQARALAQHILVCDMLANRLGALEEEPEENKP